MTTLGRLSREFAVCLGYRLMAVPIPKRFSVWLFDSFSHIMQLIIIRISGDMLADLDMTVIEDGN